MQCPKDANSILEHVGMQYDCMNHRFQTTTNDLWVIGTKVQIILYGYELVRKQTLMIEFSQIKRLYWTHRKNHIFSSAELFALEHVILLEIIIYKSAVCESYVWGLSSKIGWHGKR